MHDRDAHAKNDFMMSSPTAAKAAWSFSTSAGKSRMSAQGCGGFCISRRTPVALPIDRMARQRGAAPASLRSVFTNLIRISRERDAALPVVHHQNAWGRLVLRAHWLEPIAAPTGALVGVTVQQQERLALVMMRNMQAAGLSEKQKQACLLLGQNHSFASIATQLHISQATAKDYADRIYRKLDVHTRDELLQKLH